jgi:hypothetical protein
MDNIDPKILKIVALAKQGIGGEKETAIALVKKICERDGLDFDAVMSDTDAPKEVTLDDFKVRGRDELQIAIQVAARFATSKEHPEVAGWYYAFDKTIRLRYTTTAAKHIDTINAITVYLKAYRKEKKKFLASLNKAFYSHHGLFSMYHEDADDEEEKPKTLEERQEAWRAAHMSMAMTESVNLTKEIGDGNREK